ncbi:MAG: cellulose biosynthesis cyclic di-GMP-binding regulatory protein BcsB [Acidobacteria bacterium]|nr:cellulose biosynthesis cyclic di-GMP-binding regulatory protein BcsB [Acidobacteriota bacterium]
MISALRSAAIAVLLLAASPGAAVLAQEAPASEAAVDVYARFRDNPEVTTEPVEGGLWRARLPLAALRAPQGPIRLNGAKATEAVSFEIAPQADIQSARVVLRHVSGRAQEGTKPQLRLSLNDRFVAQVDGVTERAAAVNEIVLDPSGLFSGFNTLRIDAVQRYTYGCQDPDAAELWTDVDTARSYVEVVYARRPFGASLADLDAVVSAGIGGVAQLGIVAGGADPDAQSLRWGALAAQAVGNRMDYKLPKITRLDAGAVQSAGQGTDLIAVGTPEQLGALAPPQLTGLKGDASWLSIGPSPADPSHFLILVSGRTPAAIDGALRALAANAFPLSDTGSLLLQPAEVPQGAVLAKRRPLDVDAKYVFRDLGFAEMSVLGQERGEARLSFSLPADVHFRAKADVVFALDFAYGAGLDDKSVVNVVVNGAFQRAVRLTNPDGEVTPGYQVAVPASAFRPGRNEAVFEIELSSPSEGECAARSTRHLAFVLKDTSTMTLPAADRFVELPNLALLSEAGFPFAGQDEAPFALRAADAGPATAAAVWTLAARLGQIHGAAFFDTDFGLGLDLPDAHTLVVGARPDLGGFLPVQVNMPDGQPADGFSRDFSLVDLGDNGLIIEGESPGHPGKLVALVTAESADQLLASARTLVEPSHWSQLKGGAVVWRDHAATIVSRAASDTFEVGNMSPGDIARMKSGRAPWRWILTIAAALFALAAALALIARYMRDRVKDK